MDSCYCCSIFVFGQYYNHSLKKFRATHEGQIAQSVLGEMINGRTIKTISGSEILKKRGESVNDQSSTE